jgi:autotransporter-associated beta strand protein
MREVGHTERRRNVKTMHGGRIRRAFWGGLAAVLIVALVAGRAHATIYTWTGGDTGSGNWSVTANWDANGVPVSADTNYLYFSANPNGFVSTNDLGANPFALFGMTFGSGLPAPFALAGTNALQFSFSANQAITNNSANKVTITSPIKFKAANRDLNFAGAGAGDTEVTGVYYFPHQSTLTIDAARGGNVMLNQIDLYTRSSYFYNKTPVASGIVSSRSNQGPANFITVNSLTFGPNPVSGYEGIIHSYSGQALTINSSIGDNGTNAVSLTKAGPYALNLGGNNSLGGTLRINEGTVALTNSSSTTARNVIIDGTMSGTLDIGGGCTFSTTGSGTVLYVRRALGGTAVSGSGTLNLSGDVQVSCTAVASGSQTTLGANIGLGTASRTFAVDNGSSDPDLIVSGAIGGSGGLIKAGAGQMRLSTNSGYSGQTRISAGSLYLSGGSAATTEAVGPLSFTGQNMISIDAAAGGVARLSAPSLTRVGKGVLVFCGDSPGAAAGPNVAQIRLATTPALVGSGTGVYTPVYPFGVGSGRVDDWGSRLTSPDGGGFLTYDAGTDSLRILSRTAEYTNSWTGADNANVYVGGGSINLTSSRTIQSFMLNDNSGAHAINGNAGVQLTISSGLSFGHYYNMLTYNVPSLTFGNPTTGYEGIIYNFASDTASGQGTTINSVIRDNGANSVSLTIAGLGPTYVGGTNTYSGPTTVAGAGLITNAAAGVATLTVNAAADQAFGGSLAGNLNVVKNGAGSLALTNATVNVGGTLTVNEGTVYLAVLCSASRPTPA